MLNILVQHNRTIPRHPIALNSKQKYLHPAFCRTEALSHSPAPISVQISASTNCRISYLQSLNVIPGFRLQMPAGLPYLVTIFQSFQLLLYGSFTPLMPQSFRIYLRISKAFSNQITEVLPSKHIRFSVAGNEFSTLSTIVLRKTTHPPRSILPYPWPYPNSTYGNLLSRSCFKPHLRKSFIYGLIQTTTTEIFAPLHPQCILQCIYFVFSIQVSGLSVKGRI